MLVGICGDRLADLIVPMAHFVDCGTDPRNQIVGRGLLQRQKALLLLGEMIASRPGLPARCRRFSGAWVK
jgi:hypothetical protein